MLASQPTVPDKITAGDSLQFDFTVDDYPSDDGWVVTYYFFNSTSNFDFEATADGNGGYEVNVLPTITTGWPVGVYSYQARAVKGTETHSVDSGCDIEIAPNVSSGPIDGRSWAQKMLDALETRIADRTAQVTNSYVIGDRQINKMTLEELITARDRMKQIVLQEQNAKRATKGLDSRRKIRTRFAFFR